MKRLATVLAISFLGLSCASPLLESNTSTNEEVKVQFVPPYEVVALKGVDIDSVNRAVDKLGLKHCFNTMSDGDIEKIDIDVIPDGMVFIQVDDNLKEGIVGQVRWRSSVGLIKLTSRASDDEYVIGHEFVHFASKLGNEHHAEKGLFKSAVERTWYVPPEVQFEMIKKCLTVDTKSKKLATSSQSK